MASKGKGKVSSKGSGTDAMDHVETIIKWGVLEVENAAIWTWSKGAKHFLETWTLLRFALVVNLIALVALVVTTRTFCDANTGVCTEGYYGFRLVPLVLMLVSVAYYLLVTTKVGVVTGVVAGIERVVLSAINVVAHLAAVAIPDLVGEAFDKEEKFLSDLKEAREEKAFEAKAKELLFGIMAFLAYVMVINVILLTMKWLSHDLGSLIIALLCIAGLFFMIYGWKRPPFWLEKVQTFLMYLVAAILIYHLGFYKLLARVNWGADDNTGLLIWGLFFILVAAIAFSGVSLKKGKATDEDAGKDAFELRWGVVAFAGTVLFIGLLTLGPIVNFAQKNEAINKFSKDLNDGKNPFASASDQSLNSSPSNSHSPTASAVPTAPAPIKASAVKESVVRVPQKNSTGVQTFSVNKGDVVEVEPSGTVQARSDGPVVGSCGETTGYADTAVDSPFAKNVGGLEMWIGSKSSKRFLICGPQRIVATESGEITYRTIDSLKGYQGDGAFTVRTRRIS